MPFRHKTTRVLSDWALVVSSIRRRLRQLLQFTTYHLEDALTVNNLSSRGRSYIHNISSRGRSYS